MNLDQIKQETEHDDSPVDLTVYDRSGEQYVAKDGTPTVFVIVGEYSKRFRANERPITNRRLKDSRIGDDEVDADELERRIAERIACGVVEWRGVEDAAGSPIPFSLKNCTEIFMAAPWIRKQVEKAIRGHAGFFVRGSPS